MSSLVSYGNRVFGTADLQSKIQLSLKAYHLWNQGNLPLRLADDPKDIPGTPMLPDTPILVQPQLVPSMRSSTLSPSSYILHNIAHIEITAIHSYWDTILRFNHQVQRPRQFVDDFLAVVNDECHHFQWCQNRLLELGNRYGDIVAHGGLWDFVVATSDDVRARLAIVPMAQEARGLDAGPRFVRTLEKEGDHVSAEIVSRIVQDEVRHVEAGTRWYKKLCNDSNQDPVSLFHTLIRQYMPSGFRKTHFNADDRHRAGISPEYYEPLLGPRA